MYATAPQPLVPAVSICSPPRPKVNDVQDNAWIPQVENDKKASQPPPRPTAPARRSSPARKTVAFGRTTTNDKKTDTAVRKELNAIKKTVSDQGSQIAALQDALESRDALRDAQIEKLTRLVEALVSNQSAASSPAPNQSARPTPLVDQSAQSKSNPRQSAETGTSVGVSLVEPTKQRGTVALRNSDQSEKENAAPPTNGNKRFPAFVDSVEGVSMVDQSVARLDARDLQSLDKEMEGEGDDDVNELMDKLASKWLVKKGNDNKKSAPSKWSLLISEAGANQSLGGELDALTMKYLPDKQLQTLATRNRHRQVAPPEPRASTPPSAVRVRGRRTYTWEHEFTSVGGSPGFSVATEEYLGRHGLRERRGERNELRGVKYTGNKLRGIEEDCSCYGECRGHY